MRKKLIIIVFVGLFVIHASGQNPPLDKNWEVVFVDSFSTFNTGRWYKGYGVHNAGLENNEGVEFCTYENAYIENGKLVLRTQEENHLCTHPGNCRYANNTHKYTSGSIASCTTYKYGYYEVYAKLPTGSGYSPIFWMWNQYNAPINCWYNEINVYEIRGNVSYEYDYGVHANFTCPEPENELAITNIVACNYADAYHWYGIEIKSLGI